MILHWLRSKRGLRAIWVGFVLLTWAVLVVVAGLIWVTVDPTMFKGFSWPREWEAIKAGKLGSD